jgi:tetratricopeptide (TPR) repeat protein
LEFERAAKLDKQYEKDVEYAKKIVAECTHRLDKLNVIHLNSLKERPLPQVYETDFYFENTPIGCVVMYICTSENKRQQTRSLIFRSENPDFFKEAPIGEVAIYSTKDASVSLGCPENYAEVLEYLYKDDLLEKREVMKSAELYEEGSKAMVLGRYDEAIRLFDECLCNNPPPDLAAVAYWNIAVSIHSKYRFGERKSGSVTDAEMKWLIRMTTCAEKAVRIIEKQLVECHGEKMINELGRINTEAKSMIKQYMLYGASFYDTRTGRWVLRDLDAVKKADVEPLHCLAEEENREAEKRQQQSAPVQESQQQSVDERTSYVPLIAAAVITVIIIGTVMVHYVGVSKSQRTSNISSGDASGRIEVPTPIKAKKESSSNQSARPINDQIAKTTPNKQDEGIFNKEIEKHEREIRTESETKRIQDIPKVTNEFGIPISTVPPGATRLILTKAVVILPNGESEPANVTNYEIRNGNVLFVRTAEYYPSDAYMHCSYTFEVMKQNSPTFPWQQNINPLMRRR